MEGRATTHDEQSSMDGEATRQALLDAAERLFATKGILSTSIRSVNETAGFGAASVHYHFGSKTQLLRAVLARRGDKVVTEAKERVKELLASDNPPSIRSIVLAAYEPHVNLITSDTERGCYWEQILGQLGIARDPLLTELFGPITDEFIAVLMRTAPNIDRSTAVAHWYIASLTLINLIGIYAHTLATGSTIGKTSPATFLAAIPEFVASGLAGAIESQVQPSTFASDI